MISGIDPKIDYVFKRLLGREKNLDLLQHVLNAVLQPPPEARITALELLNPFNDKDALDDKLSILDIKARDQQGRRFNVEMQMVATSYFHKRILYYWARLHQQQLHEGDEYFQLKPTISICFVDSVLFPGIPSYHLHFQLRAQPGNVLFNDHLNIHLLELPKFQRPVEELANPLEVWLYFLRHGATLDDTALPKPLQAAPIYRALEEMRMLSQDEIERERYEARLKAYRDALHLVRATEYEHELGRKEGEQIGGFMGTIRLCQRQLGREPTPEADLRKLPPEKLQEMAEQLERELFG